MRLKNPIALTAVATTALLLGVALEQSVLAQQPDAAQIQKMREEALERAKRQGEERKREQDAFWARAMPQVLAPAPASPWLEAEKRFYADLVALASAKVIVVPPTIPEGEPGIDLTSRITIARLLAAQIEADAGPIPDPGLVYRAFGEARTLTHASVREQLNRSSAQWFIVGTVRRSGDRLQVSFTQIPARAPGPTEPVPAFKIDNLEIGAEPPELRVAHYIPDAAAALGYPSSPARAAITKPNPLALPESLAGSFPVDASTLGGVWMQQMLGVLQVPYFDTSSRPQERVFERTLAALIALPKAAPDRAVLLARALAYLDRREATLRALAEAPETPEKKALAAYLAADLPALQAALANVTRP